MQIGIRWFSTGFESYDYKCILSADGREFDRFIEQCTLQYIQNLHVKGEFALHNNLYDNDKLDKED